MRAACGSQVARIVLVVVLWRLCDSWVFGDDCLLCVGEVVSGDVESVVSHGTLERDALVDFGFDDGLREFFEFVLSGGFDIVV